MLILKGNALVKRIVFGKCSFFKRNEVKKVDITDPDAEIRRFEKIKDLISKQLNEFYHQTMTKYGAENAGIFKIHGMIIEDSLYNETVLGFIKNQKVNAEYAVFLACKEISGMFEALDDDYMKQRAADIKDVSNRLICNFSEVVSCFGEDNIILIFENITPSEVLGLHERTCGIIDTAGSLNSHASILAKALNIPMIVNADVMIKDSIDGQKVIIDGFANTIYVDPDNITTKRLKKKLRLIEKKGELLKELRGKDNITRDGQKIKLYANIGGTQEVNLALENDAGGIGLFRSEFLFLNRASCPAEDEQFEAYSSVLKKMGSKEVIFRTLDIGADKKIDYLNLPTEENPALGYRGIRLCLDRPGLFKTQLRAIYRASVFGNAGVMFPMIITIDEVKKIKKLIAEVKTELDGKNLAYSKNVKIGVMIETPAAVFISNELAKEVDFFSIGTNDLMQYSLAVDRQNNKVINTYNHHHIAILRMIKMVVDNAHKNGIWVGICGELAGDIELIETFLAFGVDELSMSSPFILEIRKKILETNVDKIRDKILKKI